MSPPPTYTNNNTTIKSLAANCHLPVYEFTYVDPNHPGWCEVCGHPAFPNRFDGNDVMLGDCYSNGGLEKREIVICKWCLSKYTRAAGVGGKPIVVGVQSITTRHYDEQHILAVLKSVIAAIP